MTNEEQLIARGAICVAGHLILRHKSMGGYLNGDFVIGADGLEELEVEEVEVREVKPAVKPKKSSAKAPADAMAADELADLLGE